MSAAEPLVAAQGITLTRGGEVLLQDIDLSIARGEIVTLIGPNGAGKTTFVRILLGLQRPDRGTVRRKEDLRVGYLPQRFHADRSLPLTVERFLRLAGRDLGERVPQALREVGLPPAIAERQLTALSGGELQRAGLARALLRDPELLVLDEPAQGVDFQGQVDLFRLIATIRQHHGCGILVVSHELHLVMQATDRVLCLNRHLCCSGEPEAVSRHPEYLRLFGPRAAEALAVYRHKHDHRHDLHGEVVPLPGSAPSPKEHHHHHHHHYHYGQEDRRE